MMMSSPLFSQQHVWVRPHGDTAILGLTSFAQKGVGDIIMVVLPNEGTLLNKGQVLVAGDCMDGYFELNTPIGGEVLVAHEEINDDPDLISRDPLSEGWLVEMSISDRRELDELFDEAAYTEYIVGRSLQEEVKWVRRDSPLW